LSPSDAASGVASTEYKVGSGGWTAGTSVTIPASPDGSNDGPHVVSYRSTDVAGNVETARTCTVNIVTSAPTTSVSGADSAWHASDVTLTFFSASYGVSGTEYSTDGGTTWTTGTSLVVPATAGGANDGTHTVLYRSTNGAGLTESPKSCTVKIDTGAPTTTVSGADTAWHDSDVTLHFAGSDAGSGLALTEYSTDGGATWTSGDSLVIPATAGGANDGSHTVLYRSTDVFGHVEDARSCTVKIDVGAPTTSVGGADAAWHDSDVTLHFSGSDAGSGVALTEYSTDDGATWTTGGSLVIPAAAGGGNDGTHTVLCRSRDHLGHIEDPQSCTVKIDTSAPTTTVGGADDAWHNSDVTLAFSGHDAGSGVATTEYSTDGGATWTAGSSLVIPAPAGGGNDGVHTVLYRSTDALGHQEDARSCGVKIDTTAETSSASGADGAWHDGDVTLTFSATGGAITQYSTDGGATWTPGASLVIPAAAGGGNDGTHTVLYRSVDDAGNVETPHSCTVKIDVGAPTTSVSGADNAWHTGDVTLDFTGHDAGSGVAATEHSTDGGATWTTGGSLVVPATAGDGSHTVLYRSSDVFGHVEGPQSCTVKIDASAPVTTASGAGDAWHTNDVTVTLSASDGASGVGSTEYSIDGGGWTTGTSVLVAAPADHSNDGVHTVSYRSTDAAGNVEAIRSSPVKIGTLSLQARGRWIRHKLSALSVTWVTVAGAVSYDVSVDGVPLCSTTGLMVSTQAPPAYRDAKPLVEVVARDADGNALATGAAQLVRR